jgi:hypothetical protein
MPQKSTRTHDPHQINPGETYGEWTVIGRSAARKNHYFCRCSCGTTKDVRAHVLRSVATKGCANCVGIRCRSEKIRGIQGKKFGRLLIVGFSENRPGRRGVHVECLCDCGATKVISVYNIINGRIKSCGCLHSETSARNGRSSFRHGLIKTSEYSTWRSMFARCYNPKDKRFDRYGGRGITVCDRWLVSFEAFYADMGPKPSPAHSIERLEVDEGYSPENCVWATSTQQSRNRSNTVRLSYDGETKPLVDWAEQVGIAVSTIRKRIFTYNWTVERALTVPVARSKSGTQS